MRGTDWQEVNRKITEFYNAIKECEFFFVRSGKSVILLFRFLPHLQVRSLPSCLLCGMEPVCSYM